MACLAAVGCTQPASSATSDELRDDDHGHGRPPHKPYSLPSAVREISRRGHQVLELKSPEPISTGELLDIIRWLPELAADTDLTRSQWEHVQETSKRLESWAAPANQDSASFRAPDHTMLDQCLSELRILSDLVPQPAGGEPEIDHAHDHQHDHSPVKPAEEAEREKT